jgi:quercetin dioxygenase-like cupin family protein
MILETPAWASAKPAKPHGMLNEIVIDTDDQDERYWIPYKTNVWWRPLMFDRVSGCHTELLRVRRKGVLSRHLHPAPVHGFVLKGTWRYLEHDWVASPGSYVFEPPGEKHTLTVDNDDEMLTFFHISGALIYLDETDRVIGYDDNFSLIEQARLHYASNGIGVDYVDTLIR